MRLINKITIVILTALMAQLPATVLADTAVKSYIQFENGGLDMSVDDMDFGTLDTSNLEENEDNMQSFIPGMGHVLIYTGDAGLTVKDNRLDSNQGYMVSVKCDSVWLDDDNNEVDISGNEVHIAQLTDTINWLSPDSGVEVLNVDNSSIGDEQMAKFDNITNGKGYAIFVSADADVSEILGKNIHTTLQWTLNDTPVS